MLALAVQSPRADRPEGYGAMAVQSERRALALSLRPSASAEASKNPLRASTVRGWIRNDLHSGREIASPMRNSTQTPLDSIRVIDLADEKGELAGRLLADLGAEVIRVEPPEGARSRRLPPFHDGRSLYFATRNANKLGWALDLDRPEDRERLLALLPRADVLIESERPGWMAERGLDPAMLAERFPHLVVLSISDFGQTGPYRDWVATDATMSAISGMQCKAGTADREPLLTPGAMAWDVGGVMGAHAALVALYQRERTGFGQTIDLSILEAVAGQTDWAYANASMVEAKGQDSTTIRNGSGPIYRIIPCRTGFVRLVILSPRQWHALREWLGDPEYLQDPKYDSFLGRMEIAEALGVVVGDLFATMDHEEVAREAQRRGIVCTPVLAPAEILENEHFRSRGTFVEAEWAAGRTGPIASGFFELDRERLGFRARAPEIDEHGERIADGLWPDARPRPEGDRPAPSQPFEGLRVLDFGIGGVGVEAARLFADHGADVIKIESRRYPDFIRVVMSTEMSASFASSNRTKRGFGVDCKTDEGRALVDRLVREADVVTENGSTGMMDGLGLGYERLRALNPGIVMASSQLMGDHGAWSSWVGYGPSTQPVGGLVHLWDYAAEGATDGAANGLGSSGSGRREPAGSSSIFPDHLAGRLLSIAALAALVRRSRTGEGGRASVAQAEVVVNVLADAMLEEGLAPGRVAPRGNRNERGAPWGSYPCAGVEQWVAITIRDDADWQKLRVAMGDPEWARDERYAEAEGRFDAQDAIDERLREWTRGQTAQSVTTTLQMFGVPAAPMFTARDQIRDVHFQARGYGRWLDQQGVGWMAFEGSAFRASGMPQVRLWQAPWVGEHTREIARELLGLEPADVEDRIARGVLEVTD
jgi:crotonobetainyl-CoA:carnitine CoA-transferase CaiB-like acyl-CoA transferase